MARLLIRQMLLLLLYLLTRHVISVIVASQLAVQSDVDSCSSIHAYSSVTIQVSMFHVQSRYSQYAPHLHFSRMDSINLIITGFWESPEPPQNVQGGPKM